MLNDDYPLDEDDVRALQGAAVAGLGHLLSSEVSAVELALQGSARRRPTAMIALAMLAMTRWQMDDAVRHLRGACRALPAAASIKALLMRTLYQMDAPEWKQHARDLLRQRLSGAAESMLSATLADVGPTVERGLRAAAAAGGAPPAWRAAPGGRTMAA
jgi:hypothetical protein